MRSSDEASFAYHRSIAPTLGALLALLVLETMVVHLLAVALWGWTVAAVLGVLDLCAVVAILGLMRAIRLHPVTISDGALTMRIGKLKVIPIPLDQIAGLRMSWDAAALKQRGVVNLALATWPNVVVDLAAPIHLRRRQIVAIAHKLDDAPAFAKALTDAIGSPACVQS